MNKNQKINIYISNLDRKMEIVEASSLKEIADQLESELGFRPINAKVNNRTHSLERRIFLSSNIEFVGIDQESGMRTYFRTLSFLIAKAVNDVLPTAKLFIEHSLSKGYYARIQNAHDITPEELARVKARMDVLIKADLPFVRQEVPTEEAVKLFSSMGFPDKADLLSTAGEVYTVYHTLDGYPDYFYGCLAPSSGYIHLYDIIPWMEGLLIQVPRRDKIDELETPIPQPMMKDVFFRHDRLLHLTKCKYVGSLNRLIDQKEISKMIQVSEAMQEKEISRIADDISQRYAAGVRIVLVSGPSSSGKTTFSKRLETQLTTNYIRPHSISLDDYFVNREESPLDENGEYDYENINALDLDFLGKQLREILAGEEVSLPSYDFITGKRVFKGKKKIRLEQGDILLMEGIHALNPDLIPSIPDSATYKVYVSALTGISLDAHNRIPSADNRLLRRMVRDHRYRSYSAAETIKRWPLVRAGEEKWVFPHQENANAMFNSAMVYEMAALRPYAELILREVPPTAPEYAEAYRLLRFLSYFRYIPTRLLPNVSLLREFVGGSSFQY